MMAWMKECAQFIEEAAAHGVELTLDDFTVVDGALTIDGMSPEEWFSLMHEVEIDTLSDLT